VQESGPKQLRHRDRAVTWQDIEDLTYAASSEIARVKVITPRFDPLTDWIDPKSEADAARAQFNSRTVTDQGQVKILIVPHGWVRQPTPSLALIDQIKRYLGERISPTLTLQVTEPPWVQVTVTAEIAPISLEAANGLASVVDAKLTAFLHPLTGGPRKRGWPFGRQPHKSDLYALLERIVGVSHVKSLEVATSPSLSEEDRYRFLIYSGQHTITIAPPE
jgi:predicted phage baseplate assembly protein